MLTDRNV